MQATEWEGLGPSDRHLGCKGSRWVTAECMPLTQPLWRQREEELCQQSEPQDSQEQRERGSQRVSMAGMDRCQDATDSAFP